MKKLFAWLLLSFITFTQAAAQLSGGAMFPGPGAASSSCTVGGNDANTTSLLPFDSNITDTAAGRSISWTNPGLATFNTTTFKFGTAALNLSGASQYIEYANSPQMFPATTADLTGELWFNVNTAGNGTRRILAGDAFNAASSGEGTFLLELTTGNLVRGCLLDTSFSLVCASSTTTFTTSGWNAAAVQRNGNNIQLFINGTQEGGNVAFTSALPTATSKFTIGRGGDWASAYFSGQIDEWRASNVARYSGNYTPATGPFCP